MNALFIAAFTYGRGIAGRQVSGQPLPDHGSRSTTLPHSTAAATRRFILSITRTRRSKTSVRPISARSTSFRTVLPASRKRGMKNIAWFEDVFRKRHPGRQGVEEKDLHGRNATTLCFNNPGYHNFLLDLCEDYAKSWDLDGIMWGSERQGAFANALGAAAGGRRKDPGTVTCFCQYCQKKGKDRGIDFRRVQEGFGELEKFVRRRASAKRPVDGYYVTLWRLMLRYPELLAWENLWHDSLRDTYAAMHAKVKSIKPDMGIGWHIWHTNSFSPIYRAEQDLQRNSRPYPTS